MFLSLYLFLVCCHVMADGRCRLACTLRPNSSLSLTASPKLQDPSTFVQHGESPSFLTQNPVWPPYFRLFSSSDCSPSPPLSRVAPSLARVRHPWLFSGGQPLQGLPAASDRRILERAAWHRCSVALRQLKSCLQMGYDVN